MKNKLHHDINEVLNAINLFSETSYSINGTVRDLSNIKLKLENGEILQADDHNKASFYKDILKTDIYNQLYKKGSSEKVFIDRVDSDRFMFQLSKANNGNGTWEDQWFIVGEELNTELVIVKKNKLMFWVSKDEVMCKDNKFERGAPCLVKVGKEVKNLRPGFYMAFGNKNKEEVLNYSDQLTRFYWHLTPSAAIKYIELITSELNAIGCCFRTKVLSNANAYDRSDAGVLYLDKSQLSIALPVISKVHAILKPSLKHKTPLFTKTLGKGLSFAEDPQNGSSFGISRAQIIANTLYNCFDNEVKSEEVKDEIYAAFYTHGISPQMPYSSVQRLNEYEEILNTLNLN